MRRIRQGVATEAYWASTVRERNEAGADAAALECSRFMRCSTKAPSTRRRYVGRFPGRLSRFRTTPFSPLNRSHPEVLDPHLLQRGPLRRELRRREGVLPAGEILEERESLVPG